MIGFKLYLWVFLEEGLSLFDEDDRILDFR